MSCALENEDLPYIGVYYREHARCPSCLHHCYCKLMADKVSACRLEYIDRNDSDCMNDSCRWHGLVHDMVPIWIHTVADMVKIKKAKGAS